MTGLLLEPALDAWSDWGLLDVPDPALKQLTTEQKTFRDFIATAYPDYAFHTWANKLIGLCEQIADGTLNRLIVTIPPRTGKSLLVSKLFPAYWISRYPSRFCAIASYSAELAYAHSREARHYYVTANHQLSKDSTAVGNWLTPDRGGCIAAGVRGPFTGKGYALGIIDDPYKGPEDAGSAAQRKKLIEWFQSVWLTRAEPGITPGVSPKGAAPGLTSPSGASAAQVVVLTRWHQDDLIGWLMEQENGDAPQHWHVLNLPAICEAQPVFPATVTVIPDWRQPGEALCPERFPLTELNQIRIRAGLYWWNALYQQRPSPADGLLFQRQWIKYTGPKGLTPANQRPVGSGPTGSKYAPLVLSCDLSFKGAETNDYCAFVLLGLIPETTPIYPAQAAKAQGMQLHKTAASAGPASGLVPASASPSGCCPTGTHRIEVLSSVHYHLDLPGVLKHLTQTLQILSEQGLSPDAVLIEDAANGPAVCQLLRRQIPGLIAIRPVGSKSSRAHAAAPLMEAGQLAFNPGNDELINELLGFPNAANDDLVDAFCQGVIWLQNKYWRANSRGTPMPLLFSR
ncbi:terminase [Synechococcus lacustris]|nr:terminase [Synechococcus lacustris]MCP9812353.1 terminase [Synechococcus lacustris Maggiore-St4-Slac]